MRRGTTPTITMVFQDKDGEAVDLSTYTVYLTMHDGKGHQIDFTNSRMTFNEDLSIDVTLTQEETLTFSGVTVYAQIRAVNQDGLSIGSDIVSTNLEQIIKEGVINYE